jgi:anti-anti-sigma factor
MISAMRHDGTGDAPSSGGSPAGGSLFVKCRGSGDVLVARFAGPAIGQREAPIIISELSAELDRRSSLSALVLDFSNVTFLNSMGLGMCIELRNRVQRDKARVVLYGLNGPLLDTLKLTKMDRLFTIVDGADALAKTLGR